MSTSPAPADASACSLRLNRHGFVPGARKLATCAAHVGDFRIVDVRSGRAVLAGVCGPAVMSAAPDGGERVRTADFSGVREPGGYILEAGGERAEFRVAHDIWNTPFALVTRAMFLWRCGCAVHGRWQGRDYAHGPCHGEAALLDFAGGPAGAGKASPGGWHDAGDYNKYTVNAGFAAGMMFRAWEHFRGRIGGVRLALPESGNGVPDLLNELRWELEWLLTMELDDGKVSHKVTARDFAWWGPPEHEPGPQFFCAWGTTATAAFTAALALGARHFADHDTDFAARCLAAARRGWRCLLRHEDGVEPDQTPFRTGGYGTGDGSYRLWAAAELWEASADPEVFAWFERAAQGAAFTFAGPLWQEATDLALGAYLESRHAGVRDTALVARLRDSLRTRAEEIVGSARTHPFGRPLGGGDHAWFWGVNGSVAAQTYLLHLRHRESGDGSLQDAAHDALSHLFGRNFQGRSFVTGLGHHPPGHPHDRRGGAWPGYLVGGPWPDARSWFDEAGDYRTNEIAINWNASLIYALAAFVDPDGEFPAL